MATQREPEILPPGSRIGAPDGLFRDENLDILSRLLDSWFRIPGTSIRFGIDGIIGLVPGMGDILAGLPPPSSSSPHGRAASPMSPSRA